MKVFGNQIAVRLETIPPATGFSSSTDTSNLYMQALAYRYQSKLILLHVVDLGAGFADQETGAPADLYRAIEEKCVEKSQGEPVATRGHLESVICELTPTATAIVQAAQDRSVDLLVMGTHGPTDLSRVVLGSTAQELLHQTEMPILTIGPGVPPPECPVGFQSIVYATDYSPEAAKACVSALSFAQEFGAQIYVCHVLPDPGSECQLNEQELNDRFLSALRSLVPDISPEWDDPDCVLDYQFAAEGILLVAQRVKANLIVLGTRKTAEWLKSPTPGLAFQLISGSSCPVLSIQG